MPASCRQRLRSIRASHACRWAQLARVKFGSLIACFGLAGWVGEGGRGAGNVMPGLFMLVQGRRTAGSEALAALVRVSRALASGPVASCHCMQCGLVDRISLHDACSGPDDVAGTPAACLAMTAAAPAIINNNSPRMYTN